MDKLPIIELIMADESHELTQIAFVSEPAIGLKGYAFSEVKANPKYEFKVVNEEKRLVVGPAMIPDLPIYRRDDEKGEYMVVFSKETIVKLVEQLNRTKKTDQFNVMHSGDVINGIFIRDTFITSEETGIQAPKNFENVNDGTWFITAKVEDDATWAKIKEDGLQGFSIEGFFKEVPFSFEKQEDGMYTIVHEKPKQEEPKATKTSVIAKIKEFMKSLTEEEVAFATFTTTDGVMLSVDGELELGKAVKVMTPEGELSAEDGQYEIEDGRIIMTAGGLITEILASPVDTDFTAEMTKQIEAAMAKYDVLLTTKLAEIDESFTTKLKGYELSMVEKLEVKSKGLQDKFAEVANGVIDALEEVEPLTKVPTEVHKPSIDEKYEMWKSQLKAAFPNNSLHKLNSKN